MWQMTATSSRQRRRDAGKPGASNCNVQMQLYFYFWHPPAQLSQADELTSLCPSSAVCLSVPFTLRSETAVHIYNIYVCMCVCKYVFKCTDTHVERHTMATNPC